MRGVGAPPETLDQHRQQTREVSLEERLHWREISARERLGYAESEP
jgi:hypothetical protein